MVGPNGTGVPQSLGHTQHWGPGAVAAGGPLGWEQQGWSGDTVSRRQWQLATGPRGGVRGQSGLRAKKQDGVLGGMAGSRRGQGDAELQHGSWDMGDWTATHMVTSLLLGWDRAGCTQW